MRLGSPAALIRRNRNYRLLFSASAISNLGDGVSALAFPWLATLLTRDPVLIGAVAATGRLPWLFFAIPAGVLADRADRRRLIAWSDTIRFALTLAVVGLILAAPALPLPDAADALPLVAGLAALAFCLGTAEVIRDNTAQTLLPSIVQSDELETANGQLWSVEEVMGKFVGPPLAGLLIALAVPVPFLFDAATFALAAVLVSAIALAPRAMPKARAGFLSEMIEGMRWLLRNRFLLYLAVFLGLLNFLASGFATLLVLVGQELLGLSATEYGLLLTTAALGGVIGGLIGPAIVARLGGTLTVALSLFAFVSEPLAVALGGSVALVAAGLFVTGFAAVTYNIVTVSFRQRMIPEDILGRINALYRFFGWGMIPLGAMAAGAMVALLEPGLGREAAIRAPYLWGGFAMLGLAVLGTLTLRFPR